MANGAMHAKYLSFEQQQLVVHRVQTKFYSSNLRAKLPSKDNPPSTRVGKTNQRFKGGETPLYHTHHLPRTHCHPKRQQIVSDGAGY